MNVFYFSSYDETDEDCLSPNLDEITNTDVVEDSSIEDSTLSDGVCTAALARLRESAGVLSSKTQPVGTTPSGYVNLSSIYSLGNKDDWTAKNASIIKNGLPDKKLPEKPIPPEKPVSLMMVNGKMDNKYASFGNNSFLYSQLLASGTRAKDPPSYTAATSGLFDKSNELKKTAVSPTKVMNKSPLTSPVNGVNKISDNYERAVAERLTPQTETSRVNRSSLFSKVNTGIVSSKVKKCKPQDDEDEDYARDSDECSM